LIATIISAFDAACQKKISKADRPEMNATDSVLISRARTARRVTTATERDRAEVARRISQNPRFFALLERDLRRVSLPSMKEWIIRFSKEKVLQGPDRVANRSKDGLICYVRDNPIDVPRLLREVQFTAGTRASSALPEGSDVFSDLFDGNSP
jgi:hypothetical protein